MLFYRNKCELLEEKESTVVVKVTMSKDKYLTMMAIPPKQQLMSCFHQGMNIIASANLCKVDEFYARKIYEEWLKTDKSEPETTGGKEWKKSKITWWNSPKGIKRREELSKQCIRRHRKNDKKTNE